MRPGNKAIFGLGLVLVILTVLYTFWSTLSDPAHTMTSVGGDAIKNYFTYLYQVKFGEGVWFTGMNYPFGEHLTYTDAQPALAIPLSYLRHVMPVSPEAALAIMHVLIAMSFVLGWVFYYKILRHYGVRALLSVLFAWAIIFLCPQLIRASGHFGLSYACYLPMIFYWFIRFDEQQKLKYILYYFFLSVVMTFFHPYFAATACLWGGFYALSVLIIHRKEIGRAFRHRALPVLIAAVGVFAFIQVFMKITDPVKDRPTYPYDILNSFTTGDQVLTSSYSPFWLFARESNIYPTEDLQAEKNTYPGLVCVVVLISFIVAAIVRMIKRRRTTNDTVTESRAIGGVWLLMALLILLFTMGAPILWGMEWLIDYLAPLRQFRAVGRFTWMFYTLASVCAAVLLSRWFETRRLGKPILAYSVITIAMVIWSLESIAYINHYRLHTTGSKGNYLGYFSVKEETWEHFLAAKGRKSSDFQAMLLLPFIHVGSEKIWLNGEHSWLITMGSKASMQLNLPIVDVMMSRSSWSQMFEQLPLTAGPHAKKLVLERLKDSRPFLTLVYDEVSPTPDEEYLLKGSAYLGHFNQTKVYVVYPDSIRNRDRVLQREAQAIADVLQPGKDTLINSLGGTNFIKHLDELQSDYKFFGAGNRKAGARYEYFGEEMPYQPAGDSQLYEFSVWMLVDDKDYKSTNFIVDIVDSSNNYIFSKNVYGSSSTDFRGMWFRASAWFTVPRACKKLRYELKKDKSSRYYAFDEIMIRQAKTLVISKDVNGQVMVNNHFLNRNTAHE